MRTILVSEEENNFCLLLNHARDGDVEARGLILEEFREYLRRVAAQAVSGRRGQVSISDLVQSAIIDANQGFERCRAETREEFKAWLRKIVLNDIVNRVRDLHRLKRDVRREVNIQNGFELVDQDSPPVDQMILHEDKQRLLSAISRLSPEHQEIVGLRHRENRSFVEIGKQLGKSPDAARMMWNRAIDTLSKILSGAK